MREDGAFKKAGGTGLLTAGLVVVGVIAGSLYISFGSQQTPSEEALARVLAPETTPPREDEPDLEPSVVSAPELPDETEAPEVDVADVAVENVAAGVAPSIDEVRLEDDGLTVIAGRAVAGATVTVLVDGLEVATAVADARGAFAAVAFVEPSQAARVLTLQSNSDGVAMASAEDIILAPKATAPQPLVAEVREPDLGTRDVASVSEAEAEDSPEVEAPQAVKTSPVKEEPEQPEPKIVQAAPKTQVAQADTVPETPSGQAADDILALLSPDVTAPAPRPSAQESGAPAVASTAVTPKVTVAPQSAKPSEPQAPAVLPEPETQSVAVLKSTSEGVELLQPSIGSAEIIGIDTIGYSDGGDVQLSGRAVPGSSETRVYLNNRFVSSLPVDADGGWRGTVPDVESGIYTLRVDEVNTDGVVTSRLETPFKRETPSVLEDVAQEQNGPVTAITVQTGDTLWAIARERYGEGLFFLRVLEANSDAIRDPNLIYPGQVFDLPIE